MNVCIIPARGGSQRIKKKNIRHFRGKQLIAYSIQAAQATDLFGREIYVSTDDDEISSIAASYGAQPLHRPAHLAVDAVGTQEVMAHAMSHLGVKPRWHGEDTYACCIYPTVPMLTKEDLDRGYLHCHLKSGAYAFAVGAHPLRDAGWFYWGSVLHFKHGQPLVHPTSTMVPIDEARCIDINTEEDLRQAEAMYDAWRAAA